MSISPEVRFGKLLNSLTEQKDAGHSSQINKVIGEEGILLERLRFTPRRTTATQLSNSSHDLFRAQWGRAHVKMNAPSVELRLHSAARN